MEFLINWYEVSENYTVFDNKSIIAKLLPDK